MNDTEFYRAPKQEESKTDDARLVEAVRRYEIALQNGERPVRGDFLAQYPDIASELANCIDGLEFLLSTAPDLRAPQPQVSPPPLQMGGTLGDFRLIREIGRGGMGIVYEAWQNSLNRRVALKVLLYAATLDARQLRRFENEARASAHLHHSNIVPVFAVGCERGIHFYAMQIIDGQTLAEMIDELGKQSGPGLTVRKADSASPSPPAEVASQAGKSVTTSSALLPAATLLQQSVRSREFFRTIAHLGVQAAGAMEYAHQMGVVHRDIKPANLLVDKRGNLWITDFGLARFQAAPGMTAPGDIIGTLRYMSPEQATGKPVIDPRSDVYALGATLYEIATLEPAFAADNRQACLLQIIEEEPIAPRKWNSAIPTDLETIILKAMAKSPEDRYLSAAALADDLQRFLEDRPILARRPSVRERLSKWTRRHRNLVASGVLGLVFAVLILAVTTWRVLEAEADLREANGKLAQEKERTDAARQKEADQHARAAKNYQEARKVLDFLTRLGEEGRIDRREYLEKLLNYYQEFIEQHQDDPGIRDELIQTQYHIAGILDQVGSRADAIAMYELARKEQEKMRFPGRPEGPPGGPHFDRSSWLGFLVLQPAVQKDLKLSDNQVALLKKSIDLKRGPFRNFEEDHQAEKLIQETLSPEQLVRLRQIGRQQRAVHALGDPDSADLLGLDSGQRDKIRLVLDEARKTMFRQRGPGGRNAEAKQRDQSWKEVGDKLLEILTTEQKQKWKELLGAPFKGEMRLGPPPGGPGGHGDFRPKLAP